jgi:hypothetical protein
MSSTIARAAKKILSPSRRAAVNGRTLRTTNQTAQSFEMTSPAKRKAVELDCQRFSAWTLGGRLPGDTSVEPFPAWRDLD